MYLHDRFRVCLLALASRYPLHHIELNQHLLHLEASAPAGQTSAELLAYLEQHAPYLLDEMTILRIDHQAAEMYVPAYSASLPACILHCRGNMAQFNKRVAIIGAGPTGLSAAYDISRHGYRVTIFDALGQAGGTLTDAIPAHRLPAALVARDVALLQQMGVEFHLRTMIGRHQSFSALRTQYDAILLAIGTQQSAHLHIPGELLLSGIMPARHFLHLLTTNQVSPQRKNIVILGGDRTAVYAARAAFAAGAIRVHLVIEGTRDTMTAPPEEIHAALAEGIYLHELLRPKNFIGTEEATLHAIRCTQMQWSEPDSDGQRHLSSVCGESTVFPADIVLVAAGEYPDLTAFPVEVYRQCQTHPNCTEEDHSTSIAGLFLAGGVLYGPGTVRQAVAHGQQVARLIVAYLRGIPPTEVPTLTEGVLGLATAPAYLREQPGPEKVGRASQP